MVQLSTTKSLFLGLTVLAIHHASAHDRLRSFMLAGGQQVNRHVRVERNIVIRGQDEVAGAIGQPLVLGGRRAFARSAFQVDHFDALGFACLFQGRNEGAVVLGASVVHQHQLA